ncbi:SDR family NAD(P)-dependent oxidoreductase [Dactylosporangium sp. CA-233914]|uniref:SDR family NAD(P)-dependent oxidoreductase n=1 Tax=Dactylosporangium sp. CA-233914 TaxID=3239934 RepID=UPI003D8B6316
MRLGDGLEGRGVLVTGAASGIGRAAAKLFAEAGARVYAVDVNGAALHEVVSGLPGEHHAITFDLADTAGLDRLAHEADAATGGLYALVNVAALLIREPVEEVTIETWDRQLDVNLKGSFFLTRAVGEILSGHGRGGRIIGFSSAAWLTGPVFGSDAYLAAKAGIITLSRGFARKLGPAGITVNVIAPGQIDTPMQHTGIDPQLVAAATQTVPLGRMGRPDEIARVALFLASAHASYVNGATIAVTGGSILY